jgi:wobble nucleotide-excising tRNase
MDYDSNLPCYFTNHHKFLWERMDKKVLNDSKYFEKQEIRWFSVEDMRRNISKFREFYQKIVTVILSHTKKINEFVKKSYKGKKGNYCSPSKTRKRKGG